MTLKTRILISLVVIAVAALIFAGRITSDGERVVPQGDGIVALDAGDFEAFPLPDYAAKYLTDGYKSYFVEVEPGIKIHVLEVGSGFPLYLQHGNPTSGFLYRVANAKSIVNWQRATGHELYRNFTSLTVVIGARDSSLDRRSMLANTTKGLSNE